MVGYTTKLFNVMPLPRSNVGRRYERLVNHVHCVLTSEHGVPYSSIDRRCMEAITTVARRNESRTIDLGSAVSTLISLDIQNTGRNIATVKQAFTRDLGLHVHTELEQGITVLGEKMQILCGLNYMIADSYQIIWGKGRIASLGMSDLPGYSYAVLNQNYFDTFIMNAIPHDQTIYRAMRSPLLQDIYTWMCQSMYALNQSGEGSKEITWLSINAQFSATAVLRERALQNAKMVIIQALEELKAKYWPQLRYTVTRRGITIRKSPLHIEPGDKNAGYFPALPVPDDEYAPSEEIQAMVKRMYDELDKKKE